MSSNGPEHYYKEGDYVAFHLPGHESLMKGTIVNILYKNRSEYYLIELEANILALVPRTDISLRIFE